METKTIFLAVLGISTYVFYFISHEQTLEQNFSVIDDEHDTSENLFNRWKGRPYSGVDNYIEYATVKENKSILQFRQSQIINDVSFRYLITVPACTKEQKAFVAIVSAPSYFEKRQIIRDTWIQHIDFPANIAFIIGRTPDPAIQKDIEKENLNHSDIIQVDMVDGYWNLTMKDVALLNWLNINCPQIPFIFKCDDDVYVNAHNLGAILKAMPQNEKTIYGTSNLNHLLVQRDYGKWKVSYEEWPWTSYPQYLFGASILISGKALSLLLDAAQVTPYFGMEDIYLTGLVARKAGIRLRPTDRMFIQGGNSKTFSDPCFVIGAVSWLTNNRIEMINSHQTTEQLYLNNTAACNNEVWSNKTVVIDFSIMIIDDIIVNLTEN